MDKAIYVNNMLTEEMIAASSYLAKKLEQSGLQINAVFWRYLDDSNIWRLYISSPMVSNSGCKKTYMKILDVIASFPESEPIISLENITVTDDKDPLTNTFRKALKPYINGPKRLTKEVVDGHYVDDAYILLLR
ncbi:MAG: hypothetical protein OMM_10996 [Candidatus Magnetoglobus multicellularis str. Araruama]|uniref:Uncharacterized protein n=1 Tax=Candidatus Magnetoglobus multicellularis str. Araruama TaxID=890399 RepID=A0A1V1NZK5_9BACT|nr:MAG: hypothetical protein OMM_10996 [Candidatus Magnetoglobus multicellularis str. Araruama]